MASRSPGLCGWRHAACSQQSLSLPSLCPSCCLLNASRPAASAAVAGRRTKKYLRGSPSCARQVAYRRVEPRCFAKTTNRIPSEATGCRRTNNRLQVTHTASSPRSGHRSPTRPGRRRRSAPPRRVGAPQPLFPRAAPPPTVRRAV